MTDEVTQDAPADVAVDATATSADANLPSVESPSIVPDKQPGQWSPEALEKQIAKQHRKIKEYEEKVWHAQQVEAENKRLRDYIDALSRREQPQQQASQQVQQQPQPVQPQPVTADTDSLREQVRFEMRQEELQKELTTAYGEDWNIAYANYQKAGNFTQEFLQDAMATSNPAYVLVELGKDPLRLVDVLALPAKERRMVLAQMAAKHELMVDDAWYAERMKEREQKLPGVPRPSSAPPPPTNDRQRGASVQTGGGNLYDPRYDFKNYYNGDAAAEKAQDDAWYAERMRQKRESSGRAWSIKPVH